MSKGLLRPLYSLTTGSGFSRPRISMEALIESLRASIRTPLQVFLWGKGRISMAYDPFHIYPSPKHPSLRFIQSFPMQLYANCLYWVFIILQLDSEENFCQCTEYPDS